MRKILILKKSKTSVWKLTFYTGKLHFVIVYANVFQKKSVFRNFAKLLSPKRAKAINKQIFSYVIFKS